jgi:hypothetical protein
MAQTAYRKASRWSGWWLAICLTGVAGQIAVMTFLSTSGLVDRLGWWVFIPGTLPFFIAVFVGWKVLARFNRQRLARLKESLEPRGWRMNEKPSEAEKTEFAAPLIHLFPTLQLQQGAARIEWFAVQGSGPMQMRLFEHEYVTGSGKYTQLHPHTIAAWPTGHTEIGDASLATAPWFLIGSYPWLRRRVLKKTSLHDPAFADVPPKWVLYGAVPTGTRFLKPRVRAELERAPEGEEWCLGSGWIICSFQGTLDAENIEPFLAHAKTILAG